MPTIPKYLLLLLAIWPCSQTSAQTRSDSLVHAGITLHDAGKYKEALQLYEKAIAADPKNGYALYEAGNTCMALENYNQGLQYANQQIDKGLEPLGEAYTLKGNALDLLGKPTESMAAYREGIQKTPPNFMLHYNLGIALLRQDSTFASIPELQAALSLQPAHPGSNYCLGFAYADSPEKLKALLPLYYFLLIERSSARTAKAIQIIHSTLKERPKEHNNAFIVQDKGIENEFASVELLLSLSLIEGFSSDKEKKAQKKQEPLKGEGERIVKLNNQIFDGLAAIKKKSADTFWWDHYADFFVALHKAGHTEAFTYYMLMPEKTPEVMGWLSQNRTKIEAFSDWIAQFKAKKN